MDLSDHYLRSYLQCFQIRFWKPLSIHHGLLSVPDKCFADHREKYRLQMLNVSHLYPPLSENLALDLLNKQANGYADDE